VFAGPQRWEDTPPFYAAGDVFCMPCRTRTFGLEAEGFGIVFLEAAAVGLPVVAGESGGAPEAAAGGPRGSVADGTVAGCARQVVQSLATATPVDVACGGGAAGPATVRTWRDVSAQLSTALRGRP